MLKRGDIAEGIIERVDYPNRGRIRTEEGQKVTVKNVLAGQKVRFRIFKKHQDRVEGKLLEVLAASPLETADKLCPLYPSCGGCSCQTLPYEEQLKMKADQVRRLLEEVTEEDTVFDGILASPRQTGYRNKMEFSFGDDHPGGPLTLGLHKKGTTYDVLTADGCAIVHPDVSMVLRATLDYCTEKGFRQYNKKDHTGFLRFLLARRSETTGELLIYIVTSSEVDHDFKEWADRLLALPLEGSYAGIFHGISDSFADALKVEKAIPLYGQDYFYETLLGLRFKVTAFSFFQTNTLGAEVLYGAVRDYVTKNRLSVRGRFADEERDQSVEAGTVSYVMGEQQAEVPSENHKAPVLYDLYSGTGTIGQMLAPVAGHVYGIELIEEAVEAARENAALNDISNCTFIAGDVLKKLGEIEERPDYIVLDPPREGVNPKALPQIIGYGVDRMVYISCKASSFKQDMAVLRQAGWKMERWCLTDLFPQTGHIETVCLLTHS